MLGSSLIYSNAPFIAVAPNLGAGTEDKLRKKLPIGVLAADTMNTSFILFKIEFSFCQNTKKNTLIKSVLYIYYKFFSNLYFA